MAHVRRKAAGKTDDGGADGKKRRRLLSDSEDEDEREKRNGATSALLAPSTPLGTSKQDSALRHQGASCGPAASSLEKHKPAELFRKDLISAMKMPDSEPLLPEEYIVIGDAWRQDWEKGVQVPVNSEFILEPKVSVVAEPEKTGSFKLPRKLVHVTEDQAYNPAEHELSDVAGLAEKACRYDLDDLDVAWLECYNYERLQMGQNPVPEYIMEKVMEELETQCHDNMEEIIRNSEGLGIEYDENVVCDVCRSPDSEENNEMVFCDGCNVCVHQACYGVYKIPDGAWLCRTCALGLKPQCILCPKMGGAMKATKSGRTWAHVSCALWIPEVSIGDAEKMEPVTKISHIPASRWSLVCALCREKTGACIQCDLRSCKTAFHVTCAFEHKLEMKTVMDESGVGSDVKLKAYCQKHTEEHKAAQAASGLPDPEAQTTPIKTGLLRPARDQPCSPTKKDLTDAERAGARAQKIAELNDSFYSCVKSADVASKLRRLDPEGGGLDEGGAGCCCGSSVEELVDFVYQYWKLKRRSWFNAPLLTPKTEEADFLTRQQEDSLIARMKMFVHLRQDLEKVRNLCYMISRREKTRKAFYRAREEVFHKQLACLLACADSSPAAERSSSGGPVVTVESVLEANHSDSIYDNPARWEPRDVQDDVLSTAAPATPASQPPPEKVVSERSASTPAQDKAARGHASEKASAAVEKGAPTASKALYASEKSTAAPAAQRATQQVSGTVSPFDRAVPRSNSEGKDRGKGKDAAGAGAKGAAPLNGSLSPTAAATRGKDAAGAKGAAPLNGSLSPTAAATKATVASTADINLSRYKINPALRNVVHSRIFHTRRPKPYVNGVFDRTQRRLDSFFPKSDHAADRLAGIEATGGYGSIAVSSPETRSARRRIETSRAGGGKDKLFESVDSEVSISVSPDVLHRPFGPSSRVRTIGATLRPSGAAVDVDKENNNNGDLSGGVCDSELLEEDEDEDSDGDVIADDLMYPVVSDTFPKRVTRSRISESLAKVWHAVSGMVYRN